MEFAVVLKNKVTSPEEFFGFEMGSDKKMARWDKIVEYFKVLTKESDKITVENMGPSTEGNPFLLVTISSAKNLRNINRIREVNAKISDPRGYAEKEVASLIKEGKAVICQSMSLHASEIGGTQMAPELAYDILTRDDEETTRILDNVVFLMIPCFNPDGEIMIKDWYDKWLGTEYDGCGLPWLYHKYVGHDNNRDAFMMNMIESQYAAKILFREWHPQAYQDHHHMGSYAARLYVAPYCEPIRPHADPLIWRELSWYGAHIAYKLEQGEKTGILNNAQYAGWGHFGFHWIGNYHNTTSMLTESASAKLATPMFVHSSQLTGVAGGALRGFPQNKSQTNFPHPWPGGWWKLRDIIEQQKIAAWAILDLAARHKETILNNTYLKAKRQTELGAKGSPKAYIIPAIQHDQLTAEKLAEKLWMQGIELKKAQKEFTVDGITYPKGSYVISLDQPKMGLIKNLLGRTLYPDDAWSREGDGSPVRPYDTATDTMSEFMGVRVDSIDSVFQGEFETIETFKAPLGKLIGASKIGYAYDCRLNESFKVTNILLTKGIKIARADEAILVDDITFPPGAFIVSSGSEKILTELAKRTGVDFYAIKKAASKTHEIKLLKIGMYQRYWGGNIDEGWTRWLLEQHEFAISKVMDKDIKEGNLAEKYDILILPSDPMPLITGENIEEYYSKIQRPMPQFPPEFRSGIGKDGVEAIRKFVEDGGTLVALNQSCEFAIERLKLKVTNVLKDVKSKEFYCPGSTLRINVDDSHPLAYGMPKKALALFWSSPAFNIIPSEFNEDCEVVAQYPERDLLQSGWLIGGEKLANSAAVVSTKLGKGKVILIGFFSQHRAQTHGTFKLFFNALIQ
ncbi:MAG: hypothetical protein QG670_2332 [Thermoproteota archaeon]|nr:hypothetical protein [Thermoproteota archaeon]